MTAPRALNSATLLPDGTVLMAGTVSRAYSDETRASVERYDPAKEAVTPSPDMMTSRCHTATLLKDARVLIAGGMAPSSLAELYNPDVLVSAPVLFSVSGDGRGQGGVLHAGTARVVAARDPGVAGEVLEIYGIGLEAGATAQSPAAFTATGSMTTRRAAHTATLLTDGKVLVAGGVADYTAPLAAAELYDPDSGRFTPTGNMTVPRSHNNLENCNYAGRASGD